MGEDVRIQVLSAFDLRDLFAMEALNGMLSSESPHASVAARYDTAVEAYRWADFMLKAREEKANG